MRLEFALYYLLLIATNCSCLLQFKRLNRADKIICALLLLTTLEELMSFIAMKVYKNNLPVYHIYSPIEFFLLSMYFNYSITWFQKRKIGIIVGIIGILFSIANTAFIQKITGINSYFLLFEGAIIIMYCLLSFHQILLDEEHLPYRFTHFWITACLILYWGITFTGWGIYASTYNHKFVLNAMFSRLLKASNYIFYFGLALVFLRYKKLIPSGSYA